MKRIKDVLVAITTEDEDGEEFAQFNSPTIDLAIEKMGAFERSLDREYDDYDRENAKDIEEEIIKSQELGDIIKPAELEADGLIKIEN